MTFHPIQTPSSSPRIQLVRGLLMAACLAGARAPAQERLSGEAIFQKLCMDCHGKAGEGVAGKSDEPLNGDRSLEALTKYIDKYMPEDKPELCDEEDSKAVGKYIYDAFYSPEARARLHPPQRDFARLTNRQFQESVADLLSSFQPALPPGEGTGLAAKYYSSEGMNKKMKLGLERQDAKLDFDFGEGAPAEGIDPTQFSIAWQGSLLADATGWHEFRVRTPNGARLYLNNDLKDGDGNHRDDSDDKRQPALIDSWVSSGDVVRETVARIYLLGGRSYPMRLDYFKYKEKRGALSLEWKPPHGEWSVLRAPFLSPAPARHVAVVSTAFPPDDGSLGYERGSAISQTWHEATTKAAVEAATEIADRLPILAHVRDNTPDRATKIKDFIATLAERAFRRPLTPELRQLYVDRAFADGVVPELAVKRAAMLILKSPRFLYPEASQDPDEAAAARLALGLWDSLPDQLLREAVQRRELHTPEQVLAQATRMMDHPRARAKLRDFFTHWLKLSEAEDLSKDEKAYPGFNPALVADLRRSLEHFVERVSWSEASDYRELLTADYLYLNASLAAFYGVPAPQGNDFEQVKFDPAQRAGIITHPFLLAALSYHRSSSPIHRGVFLTRNVMGRTLKPPPMAIEFMDDRFDPSLTMREKVTELTKKTTCMGCHTTINPLGFSLENFDAAGRFRTEDNNKPVNAESDYTTVSGETVKLRGPRDLAQLTVSSPEAQRGFVRQMFQFTVKQPLAAYGPGTLDQLHAGFTASNYHIRKLFTAINALAALPPAPTPSPANP
jgi:mono/diheme cytochrome c family protein